MRGPLSTFEFFPIAVPNAAGGAGYITGHSGRLRRPYTSSVPRRITPPILSLTRSLRRRQTRLLRPWAARGRHGHLRTS